MPPEQQYDHAAELPPSTPLHDAAEAGDAWALPALLRNGWNPNARVRRPNYEEGATALHLAAQTGNLKVALALLRAGARPDGGGASKLKHQPEVGHHGNWDGDLSPLHEASARGHAAVVGALLSAGEDADRVAMGGKLGLVGRPEQAFFDERDGGHAPLHLASAFGHTNVVRALVEAGASVQGGEGGCDDTPLHYAARAGHVKTMAVLIDAGADVDACDEIGNTPLHAVADVRSLELLLASGANPNKAAESPYGVSTPLATYCTLVHRQEEGEEGMEKATAIVEALLRGGAETDNVPATRAFPQVTSPILSCAAKNGVPGIVKALLASGLDPDGRDKVGWAPLHDAAQGDHVEALRLLLRAGADADARTLRGRWTPLHVACRYISVGCVLELLKWGADLNSKTGFDSDHDAWRSAPVLGATRIGVSEGCGKTPAEVVGLKNRAAAPAAPVAKGGSADPSQDEDGQMEVLDADTGEPDTSAAARNAVRAALRREASWRRRRGLVLLRVRLDSQLDAGAGVAPAAPAAPVAATGGPDGGSVARGRREFEGGVKARRTEDSASWSGVRGGGGRKGVVRLRGVLDGVVELGGYEEALFRQVVMFL